MNAYTNSFGDYQTSLRINGRCYLGIGHTPAESRRNALDAIEDRNPDLAGFCAVMRTSSVNAERVSAATYNPDRTPRIHRTQCADAPALMDWHFVDCGQSDNGVAKRAVGAAAILAAIIALWWLHNALGLA